MSRSGEYECAGCGKDVDASDAVMLRMDAPLGLTTIRAHRECVAAATDKALEMGWKPVRGGHESTPKAPRQPPLQPQRSERQAFKQATGGDFVDWSGIRRGYDLVLAKTVKRVDGPGWKVYLVRPDLIRIDIDPTT